MALMFPIFTKLGGEKAVFDLIANRRGGEDRKGKRPSKQTKCRWRKERRLPGHVQALLADECAARGIACGFDDMRWKEPRRKREAA